MTPNANMKLPKDKNGREIQPGDTIRMTFNVILRDKPEVRRVEPHWVDFAVKWSGACLIAERSGYSDFQAIMSGKCVDIATGNGVGATRATYYLNDVFNGANFEVRGNEA